MALGATVCKAQLNISDMDRHVYADFDLTLAQHPSETDFRLMIRLCAFVFNAEERLGFTRGLCAEDEPDLWEEDLGGDYPLWILLGQPEEKRIRKACGRAERVIIYTYQEGSARAWWKQQAGKLGRFANLGVIHLCAEGIEALAGRSMVLQCTIQDGELMMHDAGEHGVSVTQEIWKEG